MSPVYRLACLSLLVTLSLSMFLLEGMLPVPFFVPGAKLGLANLVTVIALYSLPYAKDVFCMLVLRIGIASALGGQKAKRRRVEEEKSRKVSLWFTVYRLRFSLRNGELR